MMIYHDSRNALYRFPMGAAACETKVTLRLRTQSIVRAELRLWWNDEESILPMEREGMDMFVCEITLPDAPGVLWYYFRARDAEGADWFFGNASDGQGGVGQVMHSEPPSYQITIYRKDFRTPDWMHNSVMMQIMTDRFHSVGRKDPRNLPAGSFYHMKWDEAPVLVCNDQTGDYCDNDYFGGNLRGLTEKLDYIAGLGVRAIYLNPIFRAHSSHKYNTANYKEIDPTFGTEEDFRELCRAAKEHGIRIILDGVFSHSGSDSIYFNRNGTFGKGGAYRDEASPYVDWYEFYRWPDQYNSWWGIQTLPTFNKDNEGYRRYIVSDRDSVVAHWLNAGASGWRLDVVDELPMDLIEQIRKREKSINPDSALIGEVWEDPSNKVAYGKLRSYCTGDTLDSVMNYPLRDGILMFMRRQLDAGRLIRRIESMRENLPLPFFYAQMNFLGSHDKPRALTVLADVGNMEPERRYRTAFTLLPEAYERGRRRLIAAWRLLCALPGMPCVYYGDEAGLYGMADPFCRGTYPWGHEDAELVEEFSETIRRRNLHDALRAGGMKLRAIGEDVILVEREIQHGRDVFGAPAKDELLTLAVNRASESRWLEYHGQAYEIPAETALWLDIEPQTKEENA